MLQGTGHGLLVKVPEPRLESKTTAKRQPLMEEERALIDHGAGGNCVCSCGSFHWTRKTSAPVHHTQKLIAKFLKGFFVNHFEVPLLTESKHMSCSAATCQRCHLNPFDGAQCSAIIATWDADVVIRVVHHACGAARTCILQSTPHAWREMHEAENAAANTLLFFTCVCRRQGTQVMTLTLRRSAVSMWGPPTVAATCPYFFRRKKAKDHFSLADILPLCCPFKGSTLAHRSMKG
jgi:hypothetical protein